MNLNNLPDAGPLDGTELMPVFQGGQWCKAPIFKVQQVVPATQTATPTGFTATPISDTEIDLTWSGIGDFVLERSLDQFSWEVLYTGTTASYSDTLLLGDNQYFYRVSAQDTGEIQSDWATADTTTLPPPP